MAPRATMAMAKELARIWANGRGFPINLDGCVSPSGNSTHDAIFRRGWVYPDGKVLDWPNGEKYRMHLINEDGILALELYLTERRTKAYPKI